MDIIFDCTCGRSLRIRDEKLRGRKVKCPECGTLVDVPQEPAKEETPVPEKKQSSPEPAKKETPVPEKKPPSPERRPRPHKRPQRRGRGEYGRRSGRGLQPQEMKPRVVGGGAGLAAEPGGEKETAERKAGSGIAALLRRIFGM